MPGLRRGSDPTLNCVMNGEAVCERSSLVATLGKPSTRHLTLFQKVSYGMGHIFNDICAAMWFSYILLFLQVVIGMPPALSGAMMLTVYCNETRKEQLFHADQLKKLTCEVPNIKPQPTEAPVIPERLLVLPLKIQKPTSPQMERNLGAEGDSTPLERSVPAQTQPIAVKIPETPPRVLRR
uniref:Uncharacterized protein n=1 Tax=Timema bartmani TaxID=61472 RepID=A0A7R9F173_9NEOP|nr:unnamed protein product [Timema bartmani]